MSKFQAKAVPPNQITPAWRSTVKRKSAIFLLLLAAAACACAKPKHPSLPQVFESAKTVHVETHDARDITDISLDHATRNAILDVQDGIEDWGRYSLSRDRSDADLIVVIYKGRLTRDSGNRIPFGTPRNTNGPIGSGPIGSSPIGSGPIGAGPNQNPGDASQGPNGSTSPDGLNQEKDELKVYTLDARGKLKNLLWHSEQVHGLNTPNLILLQQLESEIDEAYPKPRATSQPNP
jgi:hypothetical protein